MNDVIIYPSSWYYNACVYGFLELLAFGLGEETVESFFQDDGTVKIPGGLMQAVFSAEKDMGMPEGYSTRVKVPEKVKNMKRIAWWWVEKSKKVDSEDEQEIILSTCRSMLGSNKTFYPGLRPHNEKILPDDFLNNWFSSQTKGNLRCSFCNSLCMYDSNEKDRAVFFGRVISSHLGNSVSKFPNSFWDNNQSLLMCTHCRSYFLCFHLVHQKRYFINSNSFKVNWYLNKLLWYESKSYSNTYQKALLAAISINNRLRSTLGGWGLQNMEVIAFEWVNNEETINYYPISRTLAELFLVPAVSSLLNTFTSNKYSRVWDTILQERFGHLLTIAYKSLRVYLTGKNIQNDPEVVINSAQESLNPVHDLLFLIYEIKSYLKNKGGGEINMKFINLRQIREDAACAPFNLSDNSSKNMVFRILELARLNKKPDVYHILMRNYIVNGIPFPPSLARLFEIEDEELFKTGIFTYISGMKYKGDKSEKNTDNSPAKGDVI